MELLRKIQAHTLPIQTILFRGRDKVILTCSSIGNIYCWDTLKLEKKFEYFMNNKHI